MPTQPCNNQQFQKVSLECSEISKEKQLETCGISQEMTMTQLKSESSSSETDIQRELIRQDACDEDPDFILTGRKKAEEKQTTEKDADEPLTYQDVLKNQTSSVWDLLSGNPLGGVDPSQVLYKSKPKKPNLRPWIAFNDLNNSNDAPYENKPKPAIEIGISFDF